LAIVRTLVQPARSVTLSSGPGGPILEVLRNAVARNPARPPRALPEPFDFNDLADAVDASE
jgi:hypothetical protein